MPKYLITLSIGPVQDFIAAARRTRDLWFGSWVLSEIAKAAAREIYQKDHQALIFPSADNLGEKLKPCNADENNCFNVGNKLLLLIETDEPECIVKKAKEKAEKRWQEIAKKALEKAQSHDMEIRQAHWDQQVDDVLEFFTAWVKYDESKAYKAQRERLDQILNARKNTREFLPNPINEHGIPKSSLDGLREHVIKKMPSDEKTLRELGLNKNERLDCVGIVKRLALKPDQFTPISRIAVDPWVRGYVDNGFDKINEHLKVLNQEALCSRVTGNEYVYEALPYDGQLLYPDRLKTLIEDENNTQLKEKLEALKKTIEAQGLPKPMPYMAILLADGDHMGRLLDSMQSIDAHRDISRTLANFATAVPDIIRQYQGHCIYAGGDDVLALLPLDTAITCSHHLAMFFKTTMQKVEGITADKIPTLSVGLGISHFMTPMTKQLDLARKAEKLAKGNDLPSNQTKNALALIMQPRSGEPISFREQWNDHDEAKSAETILHNWIQAHLDSAIPRQAGYNLRDESLALDWGETPVPKELIEKETRRVLDAKRTPEGKIENKWVENVMQRVAEKGMRIAADELIMTYRIAEACKQAQGQASDQQQEHNDNA
jgi:CRISPR-associated protein Cmr2